MPLKYCENLEICRIFCSRWEDVGEVVLWTRCARGSKFHPILCGVGVLVDVALVGLGELHARRGW